MLELGSGAIRAEGLSILASPRREASLLDFAGLIQPGIFFGPTAAVLAGIGARLRHCRRSPLRAAVEFSLRHGQGANLRFGATRSVVRPRPTRLQPRACPRAAVPQSAARSTRNPLPFGASTSSVRRPLPEALACAFAQLLVFG